MLHFDGVFIKQTGTTEKTWTIPELFEAVDPFADEAPGAQNALFAEVIPYAEEHYGDLSAAARLRYDFWKNFRPNRVEAKRFEYTTKITDTYRWELDVNDEGLFFRDLSGTYGPASGVFPQSFADYWFYGPRMPLPDPDHRKWALVLIRNAFLQVGGAAYSQPFKVLDYPRLANPPIWSDGDYRASDFVAMRDYGLEYGRENFHDGLVHLTFVSFEHCLYRPGMANSILTEDVLKKVREYFPEEQVASAPAAASAPAEPNAASKKLYMDNGGQIHYIHRDGFGDVYSATSGEEAAWKQELIETYTGRLQTETNETVLKGLIESLRYHGVPAEPELLRRAAMASGRDRQAIAQALWDTGAGDTSVGVLLSLLDFENEDSYWRDYVFSSLYRIPQSAAARQWVLDCLRGDNEIHFRKAVEVLQMWGLKGGMTALNLYVLKPLTWAEKQAGSPEFQEAVAKVVKTLSE
jgi:hypothetical protein